jgi:hypothetical protein
MKRYRAEGFPEGDIFRDAGTREYDMAPTRKKRMKRNNNIEDLQGVK